MAARVKRSATIAYVEASRGNGGGNRGHGRGPGGSGGPTAASLTPTVADVTIENGNGKGKRGRKAGVPNRITTALKEAIIHAAANVGRDGKGKDGLTGYLERLARQEPRSFAALLGRVVPLHIVGGVDHTHRVLRTRDEVSKELHERGLPIDTIYNTALDRWEPDDDAEAN